MEYLCVCHYNLKHLIQCFGMLWSRVLLYCSVACFTVGGYEHGCQCDLPTFICLVIRYYYIYHYLTTYPFVPPLYKWLYITFHITTPLGFILFVYKKNTSQVISTISLKTVQVYSHKFPMMCMMSPPLSWLRPPDFHPMHLI